MKEANSIHDWFSIIFSNLKGHSIEKWNSSLEKLLNNIRNLGSYIGIKAR